MYKLIFQFILVLCFSYSVSLYAQNPKISIQSTLKDISGKAIPDGDVSVTFRLYTTANGDTSVWNESTVVTVVGGIYSHKLGSVTPLDPSDFGGNLYLGVTIAGGQELAPRTELTAAPFAVSVKSIADNNQSARFLSDGTLNVTGNMSVNGNSSFKNAHVQDNLTNVWDLTIGGPTHGINRNNGYLEIGCNNTGRFLMSDDGTNTINSQNNKPINFNIGNTKFQADQFGAVTYGRHDIYGNLALETGRHFYMNSGNINIAGAGDLNLHNGTNPNNIVKWVRLGDEDSGIRSTSDGKVDIMSNNEPAISVVRHNGYRKVGINDTSPEVALVVRKNDGLMNSGNWDAFHFNSGGNIIGGSPGQLPFNPAVYIHGGLIADEWIASAASPTYSDIRTKEVQGLSNSKSDLAILNKIKITDYTMIDKKTDNGKYKKVIAQDIQEIFPQATMKMRKVIPDIYCFAENSKQEGDIVYVTLNKNHNLVKNDKIDLYHKDGLNNELNVERIVDETTFCVKSDKKLEKLFVYGKYVDDFLSVDYDAISMLNVSATQELYKKIVALENENKELRSSTSSLEDRISKLEAMLTTGNNAAQNTNTLAGQK